MIGPGIWASYAVSSLTDRQFRIYISLNSHADDKGRFEFNIALIRSETFPRHKKPPTLTRMQKDLEVIATAKDHEGLPLICVYKHNGLLYAHHPKWEKEQNPSHPTESRLPECPQCQGGQGVMVNSGDNPEIFPNVSRTSPKNSPQVRLGKVRLGKVKKTMASPKKETPTPPKKAIPKKTNPDVRIFLLYAFEAYKRKTGDKLPIAWGKHGDKIKRLLEQKPEPFTLQELQTYWDYFLRMPAIIEDKKEVAVSLDTFVGYLPTIIKRHRRQKPKAERKEPALFPANTKVKALKAFGQSIEPGSIGVADPTRDKFIFFVQDEFEGKRVPRAAVDMAWVKGNPEDWEIICKKA